MESWVDRVKARQKKLGWTDAEVERRCGMKKGSLREWLQRDRTPSVENATILARGLGYTLQELFEGNDVRINLIIQGITRENAMWAEVASKHAKVVPLTLSSDNLITVEIGKLAGAANLGYREGDIVSGERVPFNRASNLIGKEVIAVGKDGQRYIGMLMSGTKRDTANIKPFDLTAPDYRDLALEWVAPIQFIIRGQS